MNEESRLLTIHTCGSSQKPNNGFQTCRLSVSCDANSNGNALIIGMMIARYRIKHNKWLRTSSSFSSRRNNQIPRTREIGKVSKLLNTFQPNKEEIAEPNTTFNSSFTYASYLVPHPA
jgi:hypothetical protein